MGKFRKIEDFSCGRKRPAFRGKAFGDYSRSNEAMLTALMTKGGICGSGIES